MAGEGIASLVDAWAMGWTVVLMAGYLADVTPWGWMKALRGRGVFRAMLLWTGGVVLGLTLAGAREHSAMLLVWTFVCASLKLLCDTLVPVE